MTIVYVIVVIGIVIGCTKESLPKVLDSIFNQYQKENFRMLYPKNEELLLTQKV